jgi:hypothetical protein
LDPGLVDGGERAAQGDQCGQPGGGQQPAAGESGGRREAGEQARAQHGTQAGDDRGAGAVVRVVTGALTGARTAGRAGRPGRATSCP